jgi:hypothetical protein
MCIGRYNFRGLRAASWQLANRIHTRMQRTHSRRICNARCRILIPQAWHVPRISVLMSSTALLNRELKSRELRKGRGSVI